jgi:hypothetical protein
MIFSTVQKCTRLGGRSGSSRSGIILQKTLCEFLELLVGDNAGDLGKVGLQALLRLFRKRLDKKKSEYWI